MWCVLRQLPIHTIMYRRYQLIPLSPPSLPRAFETTLIVVLLCFQGCVGSIHHLYDSRVLECPKYAVCGCVCPCVCLCVCLLTQKKMSSCSLHACSNGWSHLLTVSKKNPLHFVSVIYLHAERHQCCNVPIYETWLFCNNQYKMRWVDMLACFS